MPLYPPNPLCLRSTTTKGRGTLPYPSLLAPARRGVGGPRIVFLPRGPSQVTWNVMKPDKSLFKPHKTILNQPRTSKNVPKSIFSVPGAPKINIFCPWSTKNQYFLSLEHQESIFSVPGAPKINIFYPWSTKNQYFLSPEHEKSIFSIPRAPKFNIFTPHSINK